MYLTIIIILLLHYFLPDSGFRRFLKDVQYSKLLGRAGTLTSKNKTRRYFTVLSLDTWQGGDTPGFSQGAPTASFRFKSLVLVLISYHAADGHYQLCKRKQPKFLTVMDDHGGQAVAW
jgi:hypothetical protein